MEEIKQKKLDSSYSVSSVQNTTKDVDLKKRVVTGLFNTSYFVDSDNDVLLPNAAQESIEAKGVGTTSGNKIKHLQDHDWTKVVARLDVLGYRDVSLGGKMLNGIYHESYYPESKDSNDLLIKIQEGLYDSRSIGFQYEDMSLANSAGTDEEKALFAQMLPNLVNPEKAQEDGFFWVIKKINLFEGSDVAFGANALTPQLGIKSIDKEDEVFKRMARIESFMQKGSGMSDEGFQSLEMELKQLKTVLLRCDYAEQIKSSILVSEKKDVISFYDNL